MARTQIRSGDVEDGGIADGDVSASAGIAWSKLSKSGAVPGDVGASAASHGSAHAGGGGDAVPSATPSVAGLMPAADKAKVDGLGSWAAVGDTSTSDATPTVLKQDTEPPGKHGLQVLVQVAARKQGANLVGGWVLAATYDWRDPGMVLVGSVTVLHVAKDDANLNATLDANGDNWRVVVTGLADTTIDWHCNVVGSVAVNPP